MLVHQLFFLAGFLPLVASASSRELQNHRRQQSQVTLVNGGAVDLDNCVNQETNFEIFLVYSGTNQAGVDPRYVEAFELAAKRWMKVIVSDRHSTPTPAGRVSDWCGGQFERPYNGAVNDVVICYDISPIDGPGRILGGAGPVFVRQDNQFRPTTTQSGVMSFDSEDFDSMPIEDVKTIILHEMGHVLGLVGTTNERCTAACDSSNANQNGEYACPRAMAEYGHIAGSSNLLLENMGGMGTACGHWEEGIFEATESSEVMTGFFEAQKFQPISSVTVAALEEIGYTVDYCGADIWPADENTNKRFEVYRIQETMEMMDSSMMDSSMVEDDMMMMDSVRPRFTITVNGETVEFSNLATDKPMDEEDGTNTTNSGSETDSSTAPKIWKSNKIVILFSLGVATLPLMASCLI